MKGRLFESLSDYKREKCYNIDPTFLPKDDMVKEYIHTDVTLEDVYVNQLRRQAEAIDGPGAHTSYTCFPSESGSLFSTHITTTITISYKALYKMISGRKSEVQQTLPKNYTNKQNKTKLCTNWGRLNLLAFCEDRHPRSFIWLKVQSEAMVLYGSIFATKTNKQTKSHVSLGPVLEPQHPVQRPLKILLFPAYKLYYMWSQLLNFDRNIFKGTGKLQQAQSWAKMEGGLETLSCKV